MRRHPKVVARCPGKLIISGEHAVVHGAPALVSAVSLQAIAEATLSRSQRWELTLGDGLWQGQLSEAELRGQLSAAEARHAAWLAGQGTVREVLGEPGALLAAAAALAIRDLPGTPLRLRVRLKLPLGAGMGSSAAVLAAAIQAVRAWHGQPCSPEQLYEATLAGERLIHGRSSGADPHACIHGGTWRFQRGQASSLGDLGWPPLTVLHTGQPASSTGECVAQVASQQFPANTWEAMGQVTEGILAAIQTQNHAALQTALRANHRWLVKLGVTPPKVQAFITELEARGGAGKVCGAGAIRGEAAGVLLIYGKPPRELVSRYGYTPLRLTLDAPGCSYSIQD